MTENEAKAKLERTSILWNNAKRTEIVEAVKVAIQALEENQQYHAIGTVDECRVAVERMKALEPIRNDKCTCPKCGTHNEVIQKRRNTVAFDTVYCWHCGQAISVVRD